MRVFDRGEPLLEGGEASLAWGAGGGSIRAAMSAPGSDLPTARHRPVAIADEVGLSATDADHHAAIEPARSEAAYQGGIESEAFFDDLLGNPD